MVEWSRDPADWASVVGANGTRSPTAPDVWGGPNLTTGNGAGALTEEGTLLPWRAGLVPMQHLSIQTGVSVAGRLRLLLARVAWHVAGAACAKLRVQRFCPHLGFAALTIGFAHGTHVADRLERKSLGSNDSGRQPRRSKCNSSRRGQWWSEVDRHDNSWEPL